MKRKYLVILVFGIVIAAGLGIFVLYESMPHHYENPNIPEGFLYTKSGTIPNQYLIKNYTGSINVSGLIYAENNKFYCYSLGKEALEVEYFSYSPGAGMIGGWSYRYALVCEDKYLIVNGADSFGSRIYGPFQTPG